ncbi:MAG: ATP-dependent sacrificial sulfur transferase LarE [Candidatus Lokiarchaeota archaeon]|nr:ATP-dependent sacrificial sulfur transferase LarE [Candidatus Lokiarchaeota archaeon]MBD3341154.1 ATP-dependent sacrificial sulfur transferase LarE [Candidatus Lokiarchaeota archaeon]
MKLGEDLKSKLKDLISFFQHKKAIIAFSGGVDSSLLAFLSAKYAEETLLITARSLIYPESDLMDAEQFSRKYNIHHEFLDFDLLDNVAFANNPKNRCYLCKKALYKELISIKEENDFDVIVDGSNSDDLKEFRPGKKAIEELGIETPYVYYNITKQDIRKLSNYFNLKSALKPSMACYASRIPYDQEINKKKIEMIQKAEIFLRKTFGLTQLRVRMHKGNLARIELLKEEFYKILELEELSCIGERFRSLGFKYTTLDINGFRSGSLDE